MIPTLPLGGGVGVALGVFSFAGLPNANSKSIGFVLVSNKVMMLPSGRLPTAGLGPRSPGPADHHLILPRVM